MKTILLKYLKQIDFFVSYWKEQDRIYGDVRPFWGYGVGVFTLEEGDPTRKIWSTLLRGGYLRTLDKRVSVDASKVGDVFLSTRKARRALERRER